ncbi:MAG TPA: tripartite tricarboxylate transporter substrate binding protein, partial [Firmicutes bacterium]|nr:tripartite tricarboxylate transporter substrate binding protein [Bacillota bacterium]
KVWKHPVTVVNKPGGGAVTGVMYVVNSKPDGYTMLMNVVSAGTLNPAFLPDCPYKWDDLDHVALVNINPFVFIVNGNSEWSDLKSLVEAVRANPSKFKYGSAGPGGPSAYGVAQLFDSAGIDPKLLTRVDLGGGAQVVAAVAGGHVDFAVQNLSEVISLVEAGNIRALAVSTPERAKQLPSVPTGAEAGFPGFTAQGWNGVSGPKGLPEEVKQAWGRALQDLSRDAGFAAEMEKLGALPRYLDSSQYEEFLRGMYEDAFRLAQKLGLR